ARASERAGRAAGRATRQGIRDLSAAFSAYRAARAERRAAAQQLEADHPAVNGNGRIAHETADAGANGRRDWDAELDDLLDEAEGAEEGADEREEAPEPVRARVEPPKDWLLPRTDVLTETQAPTVSSKEQTTVARLIEETLFEHRVEVRVAEIRPGPTVTMYGLVPGWNRQARRGKDGQQGEPEMRNRVRVDAILAREKDLALALAAPSLRIEAPVPGESVVGVEVPNRASTPVSMRSVIESDEYKAVTDDGGLAIALGQASAGEPMVIDLLKMPHLLIAGATGSGKSVCMNTIICSLIMSRQPRDVRMVLVDPKRVELTPYNGIPHLVTPVVVEPDRVVRLLRGAIQEMLRRYKLLEEAGVRNIKSYNQSSKAVEHMPYLVICIDELADLMMTSSFDVEQGICRLAQLGRATGIHLIVATQRPSVDVVTGLIKTNLPSRISFAVASQIDSRTILDSAGAERLLGRGDMLFLSADAAKPRRVQGVYISDDESAVLANHWRMQNGPPVPAIDLDALAAEAESASVGAGGGDEDLSEGGEDTLLQRAIQLATTNRQISTSLLQRRLRIGYPRAARLMDQLEDEGIVGAASEPGKPRPVIYTPDDD
ncbi:MAG: DNA translocase FtsK, partial [Chloroflexota bacterium]|nr:DNA translocase FtsK [Chloroflexota bacterium]